MTSYKQKHEKTNTTSYKQTQRPKQHYTAFPKIAQLVKMSGPG